VELNEMQAVFNAGGLVSATIVKAPLVGGYILIVKTKSGQDKAMTAQRDKNGEPRGFKTIDAAVASAVKVGFQTMTFNIR
jgi:hypothetical protein